MVKKSLLIMMLLALFAPWAANAQQTLTVCDGTTTSSYSPIKGSGGSQTEFIYPASLLGDMEGGTITSVKFFSSSTSTTNYSNTVTVFVEEVASSTVSSSAWQYNQTTATKVYEGTTLSVTGGELVITFSTPYEYNGGNLCFNIWSASNTPSVSYYYLATTSSCAYDYYITPPVSNPYATGNYLPKAEFTYTAASGTCEKPATLEYSNVTTNSVDLTWTGGSGSYEVQYKKASDQEWTVAYYDTYHTTRTINNLEPATNYQARVQSLCEGEEIDPETGDHVFIGSGWKTVSFTTPCDAVTTFPWSEDFESYSYGDFTDPCWVNEHISGNGTQIFKVYTSTNGSNSTHQLQLPDMTSGTMTKLRLPEMTLTTGDSYLFSIDVYRVNATSYTGEGIRVYASTDGEIEGATELAFISRNFGTGDGNLIPAESAAGWYTYELPIPFTGTCYIVLRGESKYGSSTYMDNFKVKKELPCVKPSIPTFESSTTTSATLSWTNGAEGQTAWQIAYSTNPNFNPDEVTPVDVTSNPGTINGLTASTTYYAYVRANCGDLGYSEWSATYCQFATECETITTFPWTENFEGMTANTVPMCWDNSATTGSDYGSHPEYYWGVYSYGGNKMIRMYNYFAHGPLAIINTPTIVLPAEAKELTFDYTHNATSGAFSVKISEDGGTTFTELQSYTKGSGTSSDNPGTFTEATISLADYANKSVILQFYSAANYGSGAIFVDNIRIDNPPTCIKPSNLACDSKTAHTATLSWTNGEEGQNAWQIAYSTTSNFNPDEVTPVDVTTNPATIDGLSQSTTYYAYVRANCGNEDGVSAWCNNKLTFTTLAGNVTPTGLAVDNASITSSQATASWNAVAGNTLHQSYDIYWAESTVTAVPEEPAAPNLIAGITATSQDITGLEPETAYKVWVRDNCGTDGYSAWSSYVTFTTAAECQTPDGLAASNVTNESATITWNTYGQEGFNLQYRISGEEWDANNIIPNVSTPYTLNPPLIGSTTYEVRVQAACTTDDSWSSALSFKTQCDHVSFPWSENFDDWTSKSECWSFLSGQYNNGNGPATTYSSAWTLNSSYGSYITLSGKALTMNLYSSNKYWAVTPIIDITTDDALLTVDVAVSAWSSATPNFDNNDTLAFAISTNGGATFTSLRVLDGAELNTLGNNYTTIYVPVTGYNGQAVRFAIFGGSINNVSSNDNRCVIDNVTVIETPSCYPVGTLSAATDVTYNSAKLSWALIDDTQDEWTVQYATNATFTEGVGTATAATNSNYELTGLDPETHYWVRVKAACSTTDDWSNAVDFETEVFCAVSVPTATNVTQTTADLNWTGASDSYNIQYRTAAVLTTTQLFTEGFETYADESALEAVWTVLDLGDGENTAELGLYDGAKKTGNYGFRFSSYDGSSSGDFDQYLISPVLTKAGLLEFAYKSSSGNSDKFRVGYSSTTNDVSAFTWGAETNSASSWKTYSETMPEDAKYFAINYTAVYQYRLYIDDIAIYEVQDAGTWQNTTSATESKQLTGLAAGTKYDVQVQGVCDGTAGNWSESISFITLPFTKTIEAYADHGYYLIASPVGTVDPTNVTNMKANDYALYRFNQANELEWENYKANSFNLEPGKGYLYGNSNDVTLTFTGAPLTETEVDVDLVYDEEAYFDGWNLVGNPFAEEAYINKAAYTLPQTAQAGEPITLVAVAEGTSIQAMEGVFVFATEAGQKVTFSKAAKGKSQNLNLNLTKGQGLIDRAIVSFGEGGTLPKFQLFGDHTKVYIPQEGKDYAVVSASEMGEMPVSFKAEENGTYTLSFTAEEVSFSYLHLIDNMTGTDVDLLQAPSYTFNATTTDYSSRFKLVFATGSNNDSDNFAFFSNGNWIIGNEGEATLQVVDVTGRILSSETVNGSVSKAINASAGVYMLRLINGENVKVQKIVVK